MPASLTAIGPMKYASMFWSLSESPDGLGQRIRPSRCTKLVRNDSKFFSVTHQPQHGFYEIASSLAIEPGGSENNSRTGRLFTVLVVLSRPLFGYYLVVDAHNEGIRPFDRPYALVRWVTRRLLKSADVTIVSNEALAKDVHAAGGRSVILPDRLPVPPELQGARHHNSETADVVVIATYRPDEPIAAIMAAAATMPDVRFAFTGLADRYRGASHEVPPNVHLTGFLRDPDYWQLLAQATVICDLTLKPDCLVCGAYEALAVGKPMVLSENPATRDIFGPAAVLTGSSPEEIAAAVRRAIEDRERLEASAHQLRESFQVRWEPQATAVWDSIERRIVAGRRSVT